MIFLWVMLYGITYKISAIVEQRMPDSPWVSPFALMLYVTLFIFWICATGRRHDIRLCMVSPCALVKYKRFHLLLLLPIYNLLTVRQHHFDFSVMFLMLVAAVVEEVLFRGFLLRFFEKRNRRSAVFLTSVIFALFHCVNLIQCTDYVYVLMQIICAFVMGICYGIVTRQCNSLLPCMFAHFITNMTGAGVSALVGRNHL